METDNSLEYLQQKVRELEQQVQAFARPPDTPSNKFIAPLHAAVEIQRFHPEFKQRALQRMRKQGWLKEGTHWKDTALPDSQASRFHYNPKAICELLSTPRRQWKNWLDS